MPNIKLSLAACDYDHLRDLFTGRVKVEGIDIIPMVFDEPHHIFHRASNFTDFDIHEMSFGRYISLVSQKKNEMTALPVFPSRVARQSAFYVRSGSRIKNTLDLEGKRVGIPEWTQTATIYARGWLAETEGVDLRMIKWVQTGVDNPGRPEPSNPVLPPGINVTPVPDKSLSELILSGDIDCALTALPPKPFREGDRRVKRLVRNARRVEENYYRETGIFPIMHLICVKNEVLEKYPWVAMNLFEAFEDAKNNAIDRALKGSHSIYPFPWAADSAELVRDMFEGDMWPYGLEPNRRTIEAFLRFGFEQGVAHLNLKPEVLFAPQTLNIAKT